MKPQSNLPESCSPLGRCTQRNCSSLELFPQFRERQTGLCGRTKMNLCSDENQKVSGDRQYSQLPLIQLLGEVFLY